MLRACADLYDRRIPETEMRGLCPFRKKDMLSLVRELFLKLTYADHKFKIVLCQSFIGLVQ